MKYLIFGKFSFNHIYFLLYAIFAFTREVMKDYLKGNEVASNFYSAYLVILSRFLTVFPFLIYKKLSKSKREGENREAKKSKSEGEIDYIYNDKNNDIQKHLAKSTFLVAIFEFLAEIPICIFYFFDSVPFSSNYQLEIIMIFNTVTQYFASYFILNYQFYKHHYLSFGINFSCSIIFLIIDIAEIVKQKIIQYQFYISGFLRMLKLIFFAIKDNYAKKALDEEYLSIYALMLIMGLYETLFLAVFSVPFIFLKTNDSNQIIFIEFYEYLKGTKLILSIFVFICNFLYETFLLILIGRFSPSHLPLAFLMHSFLSNIYNIIKNASNDNENKYYLFTNFVFYIILFIATMIHNEIIIINGFGFNTNTKKFLTMKLNEEIKGNQLLAEDDNNTFNHQDTINENSFPMEDIVSTD